MGERILILDPGLVVSEGHHLGVSGMLGAAAIDMGHEPIVVANAASPLSSITYEGREIPLVAALPQSPYPGAGVRTMDELIAFNDGAYRQLADLPAHLFDEPVRVLVHTTNEIQVLGLARWLSEEVGEGAEHRVKSAVVTLMMPIPINHRASDYEEEDPTVCELYRRALGVIAGRPGIAILGFGEVVAEDHARSSKVAVEAGRALAPGYGRPIQPKAESAEPTVLLYMGDAKLDKGLHMMPDVISRLRAASVQAKFILHLSGSMVERYAWIIERIASAAEGDERFELRHGRLSEQDYNDIWDSSDLAVLSYHPGVYARKASGICWDVMNRGIPAVAIADTWHMLEFGRYGHPVVYSEAFQSEPLAEAVIAAIGQLPQLAEAAALGRERFLAANDPKNYIMRLLGA